MTAPTEQRRIADLAADAAVHRAFRWFHLQELQLRRWQTEYLAIPAPPFGEEARAVWFCRKFRQLGLGEPHIDGEGNAVALLRPVVDPASGSPGDLPEDPQIGGCILLSAHLDTVFPPGTACVPTEVDSRILCPGATDNGAGLAALLALAAAFQHAPIRPRFPVVFAANVGEEGEGDLRGMRHLLASPPFGLEPAAVLALEGGGNSLVVDRALGSRRLQVAVTGPGGHSWADAHRPNPLLALGAALLTIARLPLPAQPRTTLNVGTFEGGTSVNSIPERATAQIDLRSTSELALDRLELAVVSTLADEVRRFGAAYPGDPLGVSAERIGMRPMGVLPPDSALGRSLRAVDRHLGLGTDARLGSTDANLPLSRGIPALAIGAGGTGGSLHSTAEWYDPTGREIALRRILLVLLDTCSLAAAAQSTAR